MIFTRHAYERYRQFHMLDQPAATDEDARVILEDHSAHAIRLPARTHRGDEVWTIQGLGVELVVKRDGDFEEPVCVTVLPPVRFRGLTPLLAEQVEESARRAAERVAEAEQRLEAAKSATAERHKLAEQAARVKREKDKPGTSAATQAAAHAAAAARKQAVVQAQHDYQERIQQAKNAVSAARNERDIILETLRVMRVQLAQELRTRKYKAALRIAVRHLRHLGATEILAAIAAVDPSLELAAIAAVDPGLELGGERTASHPSSTSGETASHPSSVSGGTGKASNSGCEGIARLPPI